MFRGQLLQLADPASNCRKANAATVAVAVSRSAHHDDQTKQEYGQKKDVDNKGRDSKHNHVTS